MNPSSCMWPKLPLPFPFPLHRQDRGAAVHKECPHFFPLIKKKKKERKQGCNQLKHLGKFRKQNIIIWVGTEPSLWCRSLQLWKVPQDLLACMFMASESLCKRLFSVENNPKLVHAHSVPSTLTCPAFLFLRASCLQGRCCQCSGHRWGTLQPRLPRASQVCILHSFHVPMAFGSGGAPLAFCWVPGWCLTFCHVGQCCVLVCSCGVSFLYH